MASLLTAFLVPASSASAADGASFDPSNIISDANFFNGTGMTESTVQSFMQVKGSACASGYTCLKDYKQTTWSRAADPMCAAYQGAANESAARIIAKVAQACNIAPQVLLVTLEKEQSLVTTSTPSQSRYDRAMGFACPDTAPCDSEYFGFYNQVYKSAWQFKRYGNPPGTSAFFTWYPVGKYSNVRFNPDANCGSSPVRIQNKATAALYYYTPYQPNAAALRNLYGTGDGCSAYGNRNFWRLYTDWFGNPVGQTHGSYDSAVGVRGGIQISGWSVDPTKSGTSYIWVNVDGKGQAYAANKNRSWFDALYPGYGPNHGFDETIKASPGNHEVCVYGTITLLGCKTVHVPLGVGNLDSATGVYNGIDITGWSVDFSKPGHSYIWVNVDGKGGPYLTNTTLGWINGYLPGVGNDHGFKLNIKASPGKHEVCVSGADASIGCKTVTVPKGAGNLDSVTEAPGGARLTGWSVDFSKPGHSYLWVDVDGSGGPYRTNTSLPWINSYFPGVGADHGFDFTIDLALGTHNVCVYGAEALLGCKSVTVTKNGAGAFDTLTASPGKLRATGWSIDFANPKVPGYIWVNVNGQGGAYQAGTEVSWFNSLYPGAGTKHGFDVTIEKPAGRYEVCISGTIKSFGCKTIDVP